MANEIVEKAPIIRDAKAAKRKQRDAMHTLLSSDDEYANMQDHVLIDAEIEKKIDEEVRAETRLVNVENIMKLVYHDVQGYGADAMAKLMNMTREDVQDIRRSDAFKSAREALMAAVMAKSRSLIEVSAMKAVKTLTECMDSKNDKVRLSAAVEVLNRTGLTATQKIELTTNQNTMVNYTDEELREIMRSSMTIPGTAEVVVDGK